MRVMQAVRELGAGRADPFRLIALHTEADRDAMFVRYADETACLEDGALEHVLRACRADALWARPELASNQGKVGSNYAELAELCQRLGIVLVGPDPAALRRLSDAVATEQPARTRRLAVSIIADGHGTAWTLGACEDALQRCGRTMLAESSSPALTADQEQEITDAARRLALGAGYSGAGTCEDSLQRCGRTMLAESSSPALTADQEQEITDAARRLALGAGYSGAGTLEFVYDPEPLRFHLVKVSAWPGHAVTEAVTGVDPVKLQLLLAAGGRLEGDPPAPTGHAVETHLRAEDPTLAFAPALGRLVHLRLPTGAGLRVDAGATEGDDIRAELDPLICKLIAWGRDREEALGRLRRGSPTRSR